MKTYDEKKQAISDAIAEFPAMFGLRAFPGDTFRVSTTHSYVNDSDVVMLYTERRNDKGIWQSFAKGSVLELKREATVLAGEDQHEVTRQLVDLALDRSGNSPVVRALGVLILDPRLRQHLTENDPQALQQAESALRDAINGGSR